MTHVLFALLLVVPVAPEKTKFEWKPTVGWKASYTTTNMHRADMGGGEVDLKIVWDSVISVKSVDANVIGLSVDNNDPKVFVDGQADDGINVQVPSQEEKYGLDLLFEGREEGGGPEIGLFGGFLLPKTALEVGEEYETGKVKAKYVGIEKVGDWSSHKFTFTYLQGKTKDDLWTEGTIWLSAADLSLIKRTAEFHNIDFGMGNEIVKNEIVRKK